VAVFHVKSMEMVGGRGFSTESITSNKVIPLSQLGLTFKHLLGFSSYNRAPAIFSPLSTVWLCCKPLQTYFHSKNILYLSPPAPWQLIGLFT